MSGAAFADAVEDGTPPYIYYSGGLSQAPAEVQAEVQPGEVRVLGDGGWQLDPCPGVGGGEPLSGEL